MDPKELIQAGKLDQARAELIGAVKSAPADTSSRTLLFQILAYQGEWDKARRHLEIIATQSSMAEGGVNAYLNLVQAEAERHAVWQCRQKPSFLPESPDYAEPFEAARTNLQDGHFEDARAAFGALAEARSPVTGRLNGQGFKRIADTDTVLSFVLEAFVHERYVWLPMESLRELEIAAPRTLLDLLWIPARITAWSGLTLNCYLPVLYPDSHLQEDDRLKLGRMTDWIELGGGCCRGVGQHVFQVDEEEMGLLEIQTLEFDPPEAE